MASTPGVRAGTNEIGASGAEPVALEFYDEVEAESFQRDALLFTNRTYTLAVLPPELEETVFFRVSIDGFQARCLQPGRIYALTPSGHREGAASQEQALVSQGFVQVEMEEFQLFGSNPIDIVSVYQKDVAKGEELILGKWVLFLGAPGSKAVEHQPGPWSENDGELLYNGIRLPRVWPPRDMARWGTEVLPVPYLEYPPEVISIDVGRQLFVDDFLIQDTTLRRVYHKAEKYEHNPVLTPETPLELGSSSGHAPMAAPFSGGVWYDPSDQKYKMWYHAGWFDGTAYAFSRDGIHWERPDLPVEPGTNRIIPRRGRRDSAAVALDHSSEEQRFKMLVWSRPQGGELFTSADGVCWSDPVGTGRMGDRSTIFFNPFRDKWVYSIRAGWQARSRNYSEHSDFLEGAPVFHQVNWMRADNRDLPDEHWFYAFPEREGTPKTPALYNLDAVAYESLMLGALLIYQGPDNRTCAAEGVPKLTEIHLGFSRDGFHWHRPKDRTPFLGATRQEGDWDRAYIHSNSAVCLVMEDELWFYYTGFAGDPERKGLPSHANGMYANAATGIAMLRRDGFASMEAGPEGGTLTTRPLSFQGKHLFVNTDCPQGQLRVEVLDAEGNALAPFTAENCLPLAVDSTRAKVVWEGADHLASLADQDVRFRFHLTSGRLYAFWVTPDESGASHGYVAGGGPGFNGPTDTIGRTDHNVTPNREN